MRVPVCTQSLTGLPAPWDFSRVLVVAPQGAAGLGDFDAEAKRLQAHRVCEFLYAHSRLQGCRRHGTSPECWSWRRKAPLAWATSTLKPRGSKHIAYASSCMHTVAFRAAGAMGLLQSAGRGAARRRWLGRLRR